MAKKIAKKFAKNVKGWSVNFNILIRPFAEEVFGKCKNYLSIPLLCKRHLK